jgi:hypothetical protein
MLEERFKRRRVVRLLLTSLGLVALLVFISACGGGGAGNQRAEEKPSKEVASAETREAGADLGSPSLGDEDAPVVMMEYADYQ